MSGDGHGPEFIDDLGRRLFVSDGIGKGSSFGTFYRKRTGSLKRLVSQWLPMRSTRAQAEADLTAYAERKVFQPAEKD